MQNIQQYLLLGLILLLSGCSKKLDITQYAATESYPQDSILNTIDNKKAMIVLAHDDDMCGMAGTISFLNKNGWEIHVVSFPKTESRDAAQIKACRNILDTVTFFGIQRHELRLDQDSIKYLEIPKNMFDKVFNLPLVEKEIKTRVNDFNPSVIFTLDNKLGGYGHAEHILVSDVVLRLAENHLITPLYIYQSVYTNHMEKTIMARHSRRMIGWGFKGNNWEIAKETYECPDGMPEPTVQIDIEKQAKEKMTYLKSYNDRERRIIDFFVPGFAIFKPTKYFKVFNREFYRVIKINK